MTCLCRGQCWNGVRFGGVLSGEWNGCPITHKCRHCPHGIYSPVIADRLHFKSLPDCEFWRLMWEVVQRAVDHQVSPRGGGGGRPLGSGRQLPPPQITVGRRPLGGGGGGGGHWRGGSGRGDWGGGLREGRLGGGGGLGGAPLTSPYLPLPSAHTITITLTFAAMLIGLNKIPPISFMAAFATSLLSILDPNTHSNPSLG